MDPVIAGALIAGGATLIGGFLGNQQSASNTAAANAQSAANQASANRSNEIRATGTASDELIFGYQERYAEYRYKPSEILGTFSSSAPGTLDIWHLAQNFATTPALNGIFIESNTPINRVKAVLTEPDFLWDGWFNLITA